MGIGIDIKGAGEILKGAGSFAKDIRSAITGEISPEKKAELEAKALELEAQAMQAQAEINKVEAASTNWFIAGARPAIMWICAAGLFYGTIGKPFIEFVARVFGYQGTFPEIDQATLQTTMFGMLGLGTMRTYEKAKGVTNNH
ncbi:MAG TPA: 3TM-type holin [Dissulfurispiraceae bacterium]|nr:3TM-type holin [Dissulfurispiraceae bacterium]